MAQIRKRRRIAISVGLLGAFAAIAAALAAALAARSAFARLEESQAIRHAEIAAEAAAGFAARCAATRNFEPLNAALCEIREFRPLVRELEACDGSGMIVASSDPSKVGTAALDFDGPWADVASEVIRSASGERRLLVTAPIFVGEDLWGSFRAAYSLREFDAAAGAFYGFSAAAAVLLAAAACIAAWALGRRLRADVDRLCRSANAIGTGNAPDPASMADSTEVGVAELQPLAQAVRQLSFRWGEAERKLKTEIEALEETLASRTKALEEAEAQLTPAVAQAARPQRGFTLVELMFVVTLIAVIAAVSMPNLTGSRKSANETSAIATLRVIAVACEGHREKYQQYPTSLRQMMQRGYVDKVVGGGTKSGYRFSYARQTQGWYARARPTVSGTTGDRSFFIDQTGVIRVAQRGNATASSPPLP